MCKDKFTPPNKYTICRDLAFIFQYYILQIPIVRSQTPGQFRLGAVKCYIGRGITFSEFSMKKGTHKVHLIENIIKYGTVKY